MPRLSSQVSIDIDLHDISDEIVEFVKKNFTPDQVFDHDDLESWADDNGYIKED